MYQSSYDSWPTFVRKEAEVLTELFSEHASIGCHKHTIGLTDSPFCRPCEEDGEALLLTFMPRRGRWNTMARRYKGRPDTFGQTSYISTRSTVYYDAMYDYVITNLYVGQVINRTEFTKF